MKENGVLKLIYIVVIVSFLIWTCGEKTKVSSVCFLALDDTEDRIDDTIYLSIIAQTDTFLFTSIQTLDTFNIPVFRDTTPISIWFFGKNYENEIINDKLLIAADTLRIESALKPIIPSAHYLLRQKQIKEWREMWNEKILDYPNVYDSLGQDLEFLELERNH